MVMCDDEGGSGEEERWEVGANGERKEKQAKGSEGRRKRA
jgi:hypothetical protein